MQTEIEHLFDHKPSTYTAEHFDLFYQFKHKLNLESASELTQYATSWVQRETPS